jgi:hypothetical protein
MLINSVPGIRTGKRRAALTALRFLAAAAAIWLLTEIFGLHSLQKIGEDFIVYWPSGRLLLTGQDPYSLDGLYSLQKCASPSLDAPLPFYNPPWGLPFILPFSLHDYSSSKLMWVSFHAGVLLFCAGWLWNMYSIQSSKCPRGSMRALRGALIWTAFVAVSYVPVFTTIMKGQIISLVLLGLIAFLHFEKRGQYVAAGMSTVLMAIKPHILYLFWIALLLWVLDRRRWSVALGAGVLFSIVTAIPVLYDPDIFSHYYDVLTGQSPALMWYTPSTGTYLRLLLGMERYWLQFVPTGLGLLWLGVYWHKHRRTWVWNKQTHMLVIVSLMTTFYEWLNDYVLLLPVITQTAAWVVYHRHTNDLRWALWAYILINVMIWAVYIVTAAIYPQEPWMYVNLPWIVPSFLLVYMLVRARVPQSVSTHQEMLRTHAGKPGKFPER